MDKKMIYHGVTEDTEKREEERMITVSLYAMSCDLGFIKM
jgi:hypothetical protein